MSWWKFTPFLFYFTMVLKLCRTSRCSAVRQLNHWGNGATCWKNSPPAAGFKTIKLFRLSNWNKDQPLGSRTGTRKHRGSADVQSETLLVDQECSGAAAHGAASPVGTFTPSDSKGHFLSGPRGGDRLDLDFNPAHPPSAVRLMRRFQRGQSYVQVNRGRHGVERSGTAGLCLGAGLMRKGWGYIESGAGLLWQVKVQECLMSCFLSSGPAPCWWRHSTCPSWCSGWSGRWLQGNRTANFYYIV